MHISLAENVEGAGSLSVPVFDTTSRLLGALFVTAPLERLGERQVERYRDLLFDAASQITADCSASKRGDRRGCARRAAAADRSQALAARDHAGKADAEAGENQQAS